MLSLSAPSSSALGPVTLQQLVALNDELVALSRAGVPLDQGLLHLGGDLPGRLGQIALAVGRRLEQGEPLVQVLDDPSLPPAYRAVVLAGVRSGRLSLALEGMSSLLRRIQEAQRLVTGALVYPLAVLAIAYGLFLFTVTKCFPAIFRVYQDVQAGPSGWAWLVWVGQHAAYWWPWPPVLLVGALVLWWLATRRAMAAEGRGSGAQRRLALRADRAAESRSALALPEMRLSVGNLIRAGRAATLADVLAVLTEQQVPLPEALVLAADASGDRRWRESGRELAERLRRGELPGEAAAQAGFPPLLRWLLLQPTDPGRRSEALRRAADSYRRRARWMARGLSVTLPLWLTVAIAGTAAVLYALLVFVPYGRLLYLLSLP
jgi:type II secretory pathway component PulF